MDHDRQDGEGYGPQEYTAIKMEVVDWSPAAKADIEGKVGGRKVYMVAATLRPETMYVLITLLFLSDTLPIYYPGMAKPTASWALQSNMAFTQ